MIYSVGIYYITMFSKSENLRGRDLRANTSRESLLVLRKGRDYYKG